MGDLTLSNQFPTKMKTKFELSFLGAHTAQDIWYHDDDFLKRSILQRIFELFFFLGFATLIFSCTQILLGCSLLSDAKLFTQLYRGHDCTTFSYAFHNFLNQLQSEIEKINGCVGDHSSLYCNLTEMVKQMKSFL